MNHLTVSYKDNSLEPAGKGAQGQHNLHSLNNFLILTIAVAAISLATLAFCAFKGIGPLKELAVERNESFAYGSVCVFFVLTVALIRNKFLEKSSRFEVTVSDQFLVNRKVGVLIDGELRGVTCRDGADGPDTRQITPFQWRVLRDCLHPAILTATVGLLVLMTGLLAKYEVKEFDTFPVEMGEEMAWAGGALLIAGIGTAIALNHYRKSWWLAV